MPVEIPEFEPHGWLRTGHLQTVVGPFLRRKFALPPAEERLFRGGEETRLKGMCHWQPGKRLDASVLGIVHRLGGVWHSKYGVGIVGQAYQRGFRAVTVNQRKCWGHE